MMKVTVCLLLFACGLLTMHDLDESRRAKDTAVDHGLLIAKVSQLQTDVADLKQSVDALGVACETRR